MKTFRLIVLCLLSLAGCDSQAAMNITIPLSGPLSVAPSATNRYVGMFYGNGGGLTNLPSVATVSNAVPVYPTNEIVAVGFTSNAGDVGTAANGIYTWGVDTNAYTNSAGCSIRVNSGYWVVFPAQGVGVAGPYSTNAPAPYASWTCGGGTCAGTTAWAITNWVGTNLFGLSNTGITPVLPLVGAFIGNGSGLTNLPLVGSFTGNGAALTNVPGSAIRGGAVTNGQGNVSLAGTFTGNGAALTNIPGSAIQGTVITNTQGNVTLAGTFTGSGAALTNLPATAIAGVAVTNGQGNVLLHGTFDGSGAGLTNIPAAAIDSGGALTNNQTGVTLAGTFTGNGQYLTDTAGARLAGLDEITNLLLGYAPTGEATNVLVQAPDPTRLVVSGFTSSTVPWINGSDGTNYDATGANGTYTNVTAYRWDGPNGYGISVDTPDALVFLTNALFHDLVGQTVVGLANEAFITNSDFFLKSDVITRDGGSYVYATVGTNLVTASGDHSVVGGASVQFTGSFAGSFNGTVLGDGTGLTNVNASKLWVPQTNGLSAIHLQGDFVNSTFGYYYVDIGDSPGAGNPDINLNTWIGQDAGLELVTLNRAGRSFGSGSMYTMGIDVDYGLNTAGGRYPFVHWANVGGLNVVTNGDYPAGWFDFLFTGSTNEVGGNLTIANLCYSNTVSQLQFDAMANVPGRSTNGLAVRYGFLATTNSLSIGVVSNAPASSNLSCAFSIGSNLRVSITSQGGILTNSGIVWLVTNNTPGGTWPVGSIATATGGASPGLYVQETAGTWTKK